MIPGKGNYSLQEWLHLGHSLTNEQVLKLLRSKDEELALLKEQSEAEDRRVELIEEQLYFAKELLEGIQDAMKANNRCSELKKEINKLVQESMFER